MRRASAPVRRPLGPLMIGVAGHRLATVERELLAHPEVGGVVLFSRNFESAGQVAALVADIHAARDPPPVVAVDHEGGRVQRFESGFTLLPAARNIGRLFDRDRTAALALAHAVGTVIGCELSAIGIDVDFAPVVDLAGGNEQIIGTRALHRDPAVVTALAARQLEAMRAWGVAGVAKHFPGHGSAYGDTHVEAVIDRRGLEMLRVEDLQVYRRLCAHGLAAVMTAHVTYPAVAPEPATFSGRWLREILRGELGFTGLVISDDLSMQAAVEQGALADRVHGALAAGCDVVLACDDHVEVEAFLGDRSVSSSPAARSGLERLAGRARAPSSRRPPEVAEAVALIARYAVLDGG